MEWQFTPYSIVLLFIAGLLGLFSYLPWQRRQMPGAKMLAFFLIAIAFWTAGAAFETAVIGIPAKTTWGKFEYLGITTSPVLLISFAYEFSRQRKSLPKTIRWLAWMVPGITLALVWTNSLHHLVWTGFVENPGKDFLTYLHGPAFWVFVVYAYLLIVAASVILIQHVLRNRSLYRRQAIAMLVGISIPWIVNILYVFNLPALAGLDLTPLGFSVVGVVLTWCFYGLKLFDLAPVARSAVIDIMDDCLMVIDKDGRISDLNPAARKLLEQINPDGRKAKTIGVPKEKGLAAWPELLSFLEGRRSLRAQISMASCYPVVSYDVRVSDLSDSDGQSMGRVVLMHEITNLKSAQDQAIRARDIAEALVATGITLNSALDRDQVLNLILDQIGRVLSFDYGSFQLLKDDSLEVVAIRGFQNPEDILGMRFPVSSNSPNRQAIQHRRTVRIADLSHFENLLLRQYAPDICSYMAVPIVAKDKVTGILALYSAAADHFTDEDEHISESFAGQVAIALDNARIFQQITEMATTDTLTGLYNRRQFFSMAEIELERSVRYGKPLSMLVIDLDHFKLVNDTYGHAAGDQTLRMIGRLCLLVLRKIDIVGRLGGEEFGVLLPETSLPEALIAAERLRATIANTTIEFKGDEIGVTASMGGAQTYGAGDSIEEILERADSALYVAKEAGRNQVSLYQPEKDPHPVDVSSG